MSIWDMFGSNTTQLEGTANGVTVRTSIITGRQAADVNQGTTITGGDVSIVLATAKPETLSMTDRTGRTVLEKTKAYIEKNPTADNHAETFQNFIAEANRDYISEKQGTTVIDGSESKTYAPQDPAKRDKMYSQLAYNAGSPDFLPQTEDTLQISSVSTNSLPGITKAEQTPVVDYAVNPYENFYNVAGEKRRTYQQTVGGADLSVFYMAEYPNMDDVISGIPAEAQRKELVIFELDSALSLSYSILRERFPVRTLGRANPITYTRGSRTIAGHIAFAVFAEDVLARLRGRIRNKFNEIREKFSNFSSVGEGNNAVNGKAKTDAAEFEKMRYFYEAAFEYDKVQLLDSLPQFHLLIMGVNESGVWSKFIIRNVSIVDENQYQGTQQPNIVNKVSWVATDIIPMAAFTMSGHTVVDSINSIDELYSNGSLSLSSNYNMLSGSNILDSVKDMLSKDQLNDPRERYLLELTQNTTVATGR